MVLNYFLNFQDVAGGKGLKVQEQAKSYKFPD